MIGSALLKRDMGTFVVEYEIKWGIYKPKSSSLYLTGSYDNMARLWNSSGECVATFIGHKDAVKSVAFGSKPGKFFV